MQIRARRENDFTGDQFPMLVGRDDIHKDRGRHLNLIFHDDTFERRASGCFESTEQQGKVNDEFD